MPPLQLRPYQQEAIASVKRDWDSGLQSVLLVASMGSGKTIMFLQLLVDLLEGKRGLIASHRLELVEQPLDKIREFWPDWDLRTGVVMAERNECNRQLISATVQTLSSPNRLAELLAYGPIDYYVRDECQHVVSPTDIAIIEQLRASNPNLKILGVTATPIRADGDGLRKVFQKVSAKYGIKELIGLGHLVPFDAVGIETKISLKGVATTADGDFVAKKLAEVWECDNVFDLVVESHKRWAGDRPTIAFTVSVDGAYRLAEKFRAAGFTAEAADGTTAKADRRGLLGRFRAGEVNVLCNVGIWTEGLDLPRLSCVHMARPTQSDGLYCQCVGRVLRLYPGKAKALILDYSPVDARNIVMAGDLLGKPRKQKKLEQKAEDAGVIISGFSFTGEGTGIDGDPDELMARPLEYLSTSPYSWYFHDGISTLGLGDKGMLVILPGYKLVRIRRENGYRESVILLAESDDFSLLSEQGADIAECDGAPVLISKDRGWQRQPATDKQLILLRKLMPGNGIAKLSKGEAARLITHQFARNSLKRAGWRV